MRLRIIVIVIVSLSFGDLVYSRTSVPLNWQLGYSKSKSLAPTTFIPSTVPGAVQLDIAKSEKYPSHNVGGNYKLYAWMEDMFYTYKTSFKKPLLSQGERLYFYSKGIDYQFEIYFNDNLVYSQEGMFSYVNIDLTDKLTSENTLKVLVFPVPKRHPSPIDRTQASNVVKPAVSYGWDWHPRLVPLGIWDDTGIEIRNESYVNDVYVNYQLSSDFSKSDIALSVSSKMSDGKRYQWTLVDNEGKVVVGSDGDMRNDLFVTGLVLDKPKLWWPHDHGTPYLYNSIFVLKSRDGKTLQTVSQKIGFRRIELVMNEGAWSESSDAWPKTRSVPPAQFVVNGRKIFAKGSNWVNPEIFPGIITEARYEKLITMAVDANMNIFRVWGGGIINKEAFFEICDKKGVLVWEDFPLACNDYPNDPHYLSILRQEAISIIKRLRKHPSLALWCGGNELFNSWSGMTDQSLALRMLNSLCLEYDPATPYNHTSPVMGMGHGFYMFRAPDGREVFQLMNNAHNTAYTEFGVPGMSHVEALKEIIPAKDLFPPKAGTAWEDHHAFGAWVGNTWLTPELLTDYFGEAKTLEELMAQSQLLQSEGYKAIFEEARRQKPYCAMALNWCYNEPWPTAVNNSLIVYPSTPKPAYFAVKNSCRPLLVSARLSKFRWREGEEFYAQAWILNDSYRDEKIGAVKMFIVAGNEKIELMSWNPGELNDNTNIAGPTGRILLPYIDSDRFKLIVEAEGHPEFNSEYILMYMPLREREQVTPTMNQ